MGKVRKLPDVLTLEEQKRFLEVFNLRYHSGRKNRLMVEMMLTVGLRVSEICKLKWDDLRWREGKILIKDGKGGKDRNLFLPESLITRLREYREESPESPYVFATRTGQPQDRSTLTTMVKKYAEKAGIIKNVYSHLLRHTALTDLYSQEKNIRMIQEIAGHSNIQTTMIYTHISGEDLKNSLTREKYQNDLFRE